MDWKTAAFLAAIALLLFITRRRRPARKSCWGVHHWQRVSTLFNGGFLDQCENCGKGRFFMNLGYGSQEGTISKEEMEQWKREANPDNHH